MFISDTCKIGTIHLYRSISKLKMYRSLHDRKFGIIVTPGVYTKRRWLDKVKYDIKEKRLSADEVYDRATRRCMSSYIEPNYV